MSYSPERFLEAQRQLFETSQTIALREFEGAVRLTELQMQAWSALMGVGARQMPAASSAAARAGKDGASAAAHSAADTLSSCTGQMMEVVTGTQSEVARLLQQQAMEWQSLLGEMASATLGQLPADNDAFFRAMNAASTSGSRSAGRAR